MTTKTAKPVASSTSAEKDSAHQNTSIRTFDEAFRDIEETLEKTKPFFDSWLEAENWSRKKHNFEETEN